MARTKNTQARNQILDASYALFMEKGYDKTSYSDIAEKSGFTKSRIQSFFRFKNSIVMSFFEEVLDCVDDFAKEHDLFTDSKYKNLYIVGQLYFSFFLLKRPYRRILHDVINSRSFTQDVTRFNYSWVLDYLNIDVNEDTQISIIKVLGGCYEVMYHVIRNDKSIDVSKLVYDVVSEFLVSVEDTKNVKFIVEPLSQELEQKFTQYVERKLNLIQA